MLVRTPRRPRLASPHKNGKCSVAHNAQAAVGFARKQTENSNNRRKVLSELKCPFTWELSSLRKENHSLLIAAHKASHYYGHRDSVQIENSTQPELRSFVLFA